MQKIEYFKYMKTPVGILELVANDEFLLSVKFKDETDIRELTVNTIIKNSIAVDKSNEPNESTGSNPILEEAVKQLTLYFSGELKQFTLPIQFNGTEFQNKAWKELCNIPYGETITYGKQAVRVGNPKACRAVGGANNKNPLGIIVPCHRVIGSNKTLTGYAGGIDKKQWLLELEKDMR